jgi:hypothetical protein
MAEHQKDAPGVQDKAADREGELVETTTSKVTSTSGSTRTASTSKTSSCTTTTSTTTTGPGDVVHSENAPPDPDMQRRLPIDLRRLSLNDTDEDTVRYWARFRKYRESQEFFGEFEQWESVLCLEYDGISNPPSKGANPLEHALWYKNNRSAIESALHGRTASRAAAQEKDEHTYCPVALSKKEIGAALGLPAENDADKLNSLCETTGIYLRKRKRSSYYVALDTLPGAYRERFKRHLHDHHNIDF